jgi:hypothetical protein
LVSSHAERCAGVAKAICSAEGMTTLLKD